MKLVLLAVFSPALGEEPRQEHAFIERGLTPVAMAVVPDAVEPLVGFYAGAHGLYFTAFGSSTATPFDEPDPTAASIYDMAIVPGELPSLYATVPATGEVKVIGETDPLPNSAGLFGPAHDVDGDGRNDFCGWESIGLTHELSIVQAGIPNPSPDPSWGRHVCMPDLNGDGYADLLQIHDTEFFYWGWIPFAIGSTVYLHLGGPEGYKAEADWSFQADLAVHTALPVQADGDPELELFLAGGNVDGYGYDNPVQTFQVVDDVRETRPTSAFVTSPVVGDRADRYGFAQVQSVGDLDGDGMDEVAVCVQTYHATGLVSEDGDLRVLTAAEGYHTDRPLFQLHFEPPLPGQWVTNAYAYCSFGFQDVDVDGHVDAYALAYYPYDPALIQVWYGPLYEPPEPLPHTGDTGLESTGHTGRLAAGATATTGDTAPHDPAPAHTPPPDGRCGCAQGGLGAGLALLVLAPFLRRRA